MSLREAINAKCKDCIYDPQSGLGTWREQVEDCSLTRCGLWPHRPVSKPRSKRAWMAKTVDPSDEQGTTHSEVAG